MATYTHTNVDTAEQYVWGAIAPYSNSTAPTHEDIDGKGGYRCVASTTERDAIPTAKREVGMEVFVQSNETEYRLDSNLTTWTRKIETLPSSLYVYRTFGATSVIDRSAEYKWYDGRLELMIKFKPLTTSSGTGSMFYRLSGTYTYPTRFIAAPSCQNGVYDAANGLSWGEVHSLGTAGTKFQVLGNTNSAVGHGYLLLTGRWK